MRDLGGSRRRSPCGARRRAASCTSSQLGDDDLVDLALVAEDLLEARDLLQRLGVLLEDLVALEAGEALQAHVEDGLRLDLARAGTAASGPPSRSAGSFAARISSITASRWSSAIFRPSRMCRRSSALRSSKTVRRVTTSLRWPMKTCSASLSVEQLRAVVDDGEHDDAEGLLHRRQLVELVEHDVGVGVALQLDDDAHAVAVRLVAQVGDALDPLLVHQLGDALDEARLVHLVGDLGDDDRDAAGALVGLGAGAGAQLQDAPAGRGRPRGSRCGRG